VDNATSFPHIRNVPLPSRAGLKRRVLSGFPQVQAFGKHPPSIQSPRAIPLRTNALSVAVRPRRDRRIEVLIVSGLRAPLGGGLPPLCPRSVPLATSVSSHLDIIGVPRRTGDVRRLLPAVTLTPRWHGHSFIAEAAIHGHLYATIARRVNERASGSLSRSASFPAALPRPDGA